MKLFYSLLFSLFVIAISNAQETKAWSLQECVDYANNNNINIKKTELTTQIQEVEVHNATMDKYPNLSASVGGIYDFGSPVNNNSFSNNYGISSNITLYNGKRIKNYEILANKELEVSRLQEQEIKDDITLRVVNAYLTILYNRESVKIAKDQVTVGKELVKRMQELVDAGTKARNDLYQVEASLASNEESLVTAENNLDLALLDLSQLLQISNKGFNIKDVQVNLKSAQLLYADSDLIYDKALTYRPEIERAKLDIEKSDINIQMARASILPSITAFYDFKTGFFKKQNDIINRPNYFNQLSDGRGHSLGISVNIPIFDKFSTKNNIQKAKIQREIANFSLEDEQTKLRAVIERAYIDAKTSLKTFEAAKKSVEAQEEAFRTAQERYDLGVLTSYDFDQVRNQLVNAQSAFSRAKYNFIFRSKLLEFYYGLPITL